MDWNVRHEPGEKNLGVSSERGVYHSYPSGGKAAIGSDALKIDKLFRNDEHVVRGQFRILP